MRVWMAICFGGIDKKDDRSFWLVEVQQNTISLWTCLKLVK